MKPFYLGGSGSGVGGVVSGVATLFGVRGFRSFRFVQAGFRMSVKAAHPPLP